MDKVIYAVYSGYNIKTNEKICCKTYSSWNEMKDYVIGISKKEHNVTPVYKKCYTLEQVEQFFEENKRKDNLRNKSHLDFPSDTYHLYVDGSYSKELQKYSSGIVLLQGDKVLHKYKKASANTLLAQYQQIPGELKASMLGLKMVVENYKAAKHIVIYYDYEGVHKHATGEWERDNELSESYYQWFQKFKKEYDYLNIEFIKVDAHNGNEFNELADLLAKEALGIVNN